MNDNMPQRPKVSICLPTYNSRDFLQQRVESILAQSFENWELIIGDSFSNDGTWEYLQQFKSDPRFRYYRIPKDGLYAGWNQCLAKVRGDYFHIATSDDTMDRRFLEKMVAVLDDHSDVHVATCIFAFIDEQDREIPPTIGLPSKVYGQWMQRKHRRSGALELLVHSLLGISWVSITSTLFRSVLLDKVGAFRVDADSFADRFWAMAVSLHSDLIHLPETLATWRIHPNQQSSVEKPDWRERNIRLAAMTIENHFDKIRRLANDDPDCKNKLLQGVQRYYEEGLALNRHKLKTQPMQFVLNLFLALRKDPSYARKHILGGLPWPTESVEEYFIQLVREWQLPWPPTELD